MSKRSRRGQKKAAQRAEKPEETAPAEKEPAPAPAPGSPPAPPVPQPRRDSTRRQRVRVYHLLLIVPLVVFVAAQYWLGREMFERYRFNLARFPELAQESGWAKMTGWLPRFLREPLTYGLIGAPRAGAPADRREYLERLKAASEVFRWDGILQLERARQMFELAKSQMHQAQQAAQSGQRTRAVQLFQQAYNGLKNALALNNLVFRTYFDVNAYSQKAWIHTELRSLELAFGRPEAAKEQLNEAINGFQRVLLLKPGDIDALEHLAWIYSDRAGQTQERKDWEESIDYAERLLDEEHDNTNAFYFLGVAYDNLKMDDRAATFYFRTLNSPSNLPPERRMWEDNRAKIYDWLEKRGYIKKAPKKAP